MSKSFCKTQSEFRGGDPGSEKHRELVIFSNKAPLLNICKSLKWYNMSHVEVLCRDKYKLRKK